MRSRIQHGAWAFLAMVAIPTVSLAQGPVVVSLHTQSEVRGRQVLIQQVADLNGGRPDIRDRIARLDIADTPRLGGSKTLLKELIGYRIQIAGIHRANFRMEGAAFVEVRRAAGPLTQADFFAAARTALLTQIPQRSGDIAVTLAVHPDVPNLSVGPADDARLEGVPRGVSAVPGRARVDVSVILNGKRAAVVPVLLNVKVYTPVIQTLRVIDPGEALSKENVVVKHQALGSTHQWLTYEELLKGKKARRRILAGKIIDRTAVEPLTVENPVLIKRRDTVKVMARVGKMRVVTNAEALQDGKSGDRIRVRNLNSRKILIGRVVGRGLVEVDF